MQITRLVASRVICLQMGSEVANHARCAGSGVPSENIASELASVRPVPEIERFFVFFDTGKNKWRDFWRSCLEIVLMLLLFCENVFGLDCWTLRRHNINFLVDLVRFLRSLFA